MQPNTNEHCVGFGVGFTTEWKVVLQDAKTGKVDFEQTWHKNTITDAGLLYRLNKNTYSVQFMEYMSGSSSWGARLFPYIAVGTDNTAPATGQKTLIAEYPSDGIGSISAVPHTAGTGYTVGDVLTVSTGTGGTARVTTISGGGGTGPVTGLELVTQGTAGYSVNNFATTGGTGTGCRVNVTSTTNGRKIYNSSLCSVSSADPTAPYFIIGTQYGTAEANGDLKEIGLFSASSAETMWSRDLFRDGGGSPTTVVKTSSQILTVQAKTTIKRASESPYSVTLDGRTVKGIITNQGLLNMISGYWLSDSANNVNQVKLGQNNTPDPAPADTDIKGSTISQAGNYLFFAIGPGAAAPNFYRDFTVKIPTWAGNSADIGEMYLGGSSDLYCPYASRLTFDPKMHKTSSYQLELTFRVTLSRP